MGTFVFLPTGRPTDRYWVEGNGISAKYFGAGMTADEAVRIAAKVANCKTKGLVVHVMTSKGYVPCWHTEEVM